MDRLLALLSAERDPLSRAAQLAITGAAWRSEKVEHWHGGAPPRAPSVAARDTQGEAAREPRNRVVSSSFLPAAIVPLHSAVYVHKRA